MASMKNIMLLVKKTCKAFSDCCQDMYGSSVLHGLVTLFFKVQENCLEDLRIAKTWSI